MRVLITGQVGVDKGPYLEGVEELARGAGHQLEVFHVGKMMYREAPDVPAGGVLNFAVNPLNSLVRAGVFGNFVGGVGFEEEGVDDYGAVGGVYVWFHVV